MNRLVVTILSLLATDNVLLVVPLEVGTSMEAAWPVAPLAAEMLEGLSEVGKGTDFLKALAAETTNATSTSTFGAWRQTATRVAEAQLSSGGSSVFAKFLSLRARHAMATTRVEASRGLERADRETFIPANSDCPVGTPWAIVASASAPLHVACGAERLAALNKQFGLGSASVSSTQKDRSTLLRSSLDHTLHEAGLEGNTALQVVGYVDLGNPASVAAVMNGLFELVDALAAKGSAGWVAVRHGMPSSELSAEPAALVGYGVELLARSADEVAKSADDEAGAAGAISKAAQTNVTDGDGLCGEAAPGQIGSRTSSSVADPAGLFHGVDLDVLARRHPDATAALCKLHGDLRAAVESSPPPWELKRLGANAVLRAVRAAAGPGGGVAGLAALTEVAQDFPSGWARALAAGSEDDALARELLDKAREMQPGAVEINSWRVPPARSGIVPLLHVHAPLFYAPELLVQAGFDPRAIVELLPDIRPGEPVTGRIASSDPRLHDPTGTPKSSPILYDVLTDPGAAEMREQDEQGQERSRGQVPPGAFTLIRLRQFYGAFWGYPPPVPRRFCGVGLTLDLCSKKQLGLIESFTKDIPPAVMWVDLQTGQHGEARAALAFARAALPALASSHPEAARQFLVDFAAIGRRNDDGLCGAGTEQRLKDLWSKAWKRVQAKPPDIIAEANALDDTGGGMPVPSATVNGRILTGDGLFEGGVDMLCKEELEMMLRSLQQDLKFTSSDEEIAQWQYGPSRISVWHPVLLPDGGSPARYVPIPAENLRKLSGGLAVGSSTKQDGTSLAVHVLLLGDPLSAPASAEQKSEESSLEEEGPLASPALFLHAYAQHFTSSSAETDGGLARWLFAAVTGSCPAMHPGDSAVPLSLAGALQRCLVSALPQSSANEEAAMAPSSNMASILAGLARAWGQASKLVGAALQTGDASAAAKVVLSSCAAAAEADGNWAAPAKLRPEELKFGAEDAGFCEAQRQVAHDVGVIPAGAAVLLVNGRQHGPVFPVQSGVRFQSLHLSLVEQLELAHGSKLSGPSAHAFPASDAQWPSTAMMKALQAANPSKDLLQVSYALAVCARTAQELQALRSGTGEGEMQEGGALAQIEEDGEGFAPVQRAFKDAPDELRIHLQPKEGAPSPLRIFASLDPLGQDSQRVPPVLQLLHEELNAEVGIVLCPRPLVAPPLVSYYRVALPPQAPPGGLAALGSWDGSTPQVRFSVPPRRGLLLSMQLNTPQAWLCSAVDSGGADLDTLQADMGSTVQARYVLEALFVEGWADVGRGRRGSPAAGRQLGLTPLGAAAGTAQEGVAGRDSIVVKSGYYQLRAPPGLYRLTLQSQNEDEQLRWPKGAIELADLAGRSTLLHARVETLAASDGMAQGPKPQAVTAAPGVGAEGAYDGAGGDPRACKETIHIFSVASGHKYERLLRIMMLSVREHTRCPLRFWLVDNFLSPNFRRILPALAKRVGFAVSSVTYKWPTWLRAQTQKQRVIWAYKILFLDVIFPRQVQRVLFIDADQIVRADVKELWDTDLKENVYGFVPFCGSGPKTSSLFGSWGKEEEARNMETVGFRFWEQGFWQKHLGNLGRSRYYHISALFVVNLRLFRSSGAGDLLRDVYQSLTEDPHSLANLDQDLPNYAQGDLPIFSLPPEWLWCESWCSNTTKARAKTIDMCQNPVRKEGKLQQARRIAPEWVEYDARLEAWVAEIAKS